MYIWFRDMQAFGDNFQEIFFFTHPWLLETAAAQSGDSIQLQSIICFFKGLTSGVSQYNPQFRLLYFFNMILGSFIQFLNLPHRLLICRPWNILSSASGKYHGANYPVHPSLFLFSPSFSAAVLRQIPLPLNGRSSLTFSALPVTDHYSTFSPLRCISLASLLSL